MFSISVLLLGFSSILVHENYSLKIRNSPKILRSNKVARPPNYRELRESAERFNYIQPK